MASAAIFDFQKLYILTVAVRCRGPMCAIVPNFIKIVRPVGNIGVLTFFQNMAAVRHLGFVGRVLGPPTMITLWSLLFAKFG